MKKLLITGASGYLGSRLFLDLKDDFEVAGTYFGNRLSNKFFELDTTNEGKVRGLIQKLHPEVIIHTVAKASSDWCEEYPEAARKINVDGTRNTVVSGNEFGAKVVFISTLAAITPINVYGKTKKEGEEIVKSTANDYLIIQPGLIIGRSPNTETENLFNEILKDVNSKDHLQYSSTREYQPTYVGHISEVIKLTIKQGINQETIPVALDEVKTKYEIAKDILSNFGIKAISKKDKESKMDPISLEKLKVFGLPTYSYKETIKKVVEEIKHPEETQLI